MTIEQIKAYMKNKGISQIELSERSKIPLGTIRHIFCGHVPNPRKDTMQAIYKALELSEGGEPMNVPKELIDKYKRLNDIDKQRVIGYMQALLETKTKP